MKAFFVSSAMLILTALSCQKGPAPPAFQGTVLSPVTTCTCEKGIPYYISYSDGVRKTDTAITISLSEQYRVPGTKILFDMSYEGNFSLLCNDNNPIKVSLFAIKNLQPGR